MPEHQGFQTNRKEIVRADSLAQGRLLGTTHSTEALLELVDTTLGVHELVLTGEEGVRIGGDTAGDHIVLNTVDFFLLGGSSGGTGDEAAARGDVHEHNRIVLGMDVCLHSLRGCVTVAARRDFTRLLLIVKSYFAQYAPFVIKKSEKHIPYLICSFYR